jgi:hypothetical protein
MASKFSVGDTVLVAAIRFGKDWAKYTYPDTWKTQEVSAIVKSLPDESSSPRLIGLVFPPEKRVWQLEETAVHFPGTPASSTSAAAAPALPPADDKPVVLADWGAKTTCERDQQGLTAVCEPALDVQDPIRLSRLELFLLMLPTDYLREELIPATNQCGRAHSTATRQWTDVSLDEFQIFLGIILLHSVFPGPFDTLWSNSPLVPSAARAPASKMSRNRFQAILSRLRLRRVDVSVPEVGCGLAISRDV